MSHTFFDEIHTIKALRITSATDKAKVEMVLKWEPTIWQAPAAKSKRLGFYAAQTWELKRSVQTQKPCIITYNVDYFIPIEGSDEL